MDLKENQLMSMKLAVENCFNNAELVQEMKDELGVSMKGVTDGYHTFDELYFHRMIMSKIIFESVGDLAWKSKEHADGTMFDGSFIVGVSIPEVGDYSYHYPLEDWDFFNVKELPTAPEYDGHTPKDITRLLELPGLTISK